MWAAEEFAQTRVSELRKAMHAAGAPKAATLPAAYIENHSLCAKNPAGEKVIGPNKDRRWLPELMTQVRTQLLICNLSLSLVCLAKQQQLCQ